jgi:TolB-like protein
LRTSTYKDWYFYDGGEDEMKITIEQKKGEGLITSVTEDIIERLSKNYEVTVISETTTYKPVILEVKEKI